MSRREVKQDETPHVIGTESQRLQVKLSDAELLDKGRRLAEVESEYQALEDAADAERVRLKAAREALSIERQRLATDIRERAEFRDVEVQSVADFDAGICREVRTDTGEVVSERRLTAVERQTRLDLDGDAA